MNINYHSPASCATIADIVVAWSAAENLVSTLITHVAVDVMHVNAVGVIYQLQIAFWTNSK